MFPFSCSLFKDVFFSIKPMFLFSFEPICHKIFLLIKCLSKGIFKIIPSFPNNNFFSSSMPLRSTRLSDTPFIFAIILLVIYITSDYLLHFILTCLIIRSKNAPPTDSDCTIFYNRHIYKLFCQYSFLSYFPRHIYNISCVFVFIHIPFKRMYINPCLINLSDRRCISPF